MQISFNYAQPMIRETMDKAFGKNVGTKKGRVAFAQRLCGKVYCGSQDAALLIWATDYATTWGRA